MEYTDVNNISFWDITSVIKYISEHLVSFILFILVFIIIYIIDHISNINAIVYGSPSIIPGLSNHNSQSKHQIKLLKKRSKSNK
jgi:hypothetical protein